MMERKKNMHSNNQNRQISSTGAVPKTGTKKETQRDVVSRVVAPIVRETPNQNISSYNMFLDWQQNPYPDHHNSDHSHQRERFNRDTSASTESSVFEQVVNGGNLSHEQQNWFHVRPQIRKRTQNQSGSNNSHNMSNSTNLQQSQPHHSSSNTAIVLPTTPNMHPLTNGELIMNTNSNNDLFTSRLQDRATQVLPLINNHRSESDERINNAQTFINSSINNRSVCEESSMDESNDLNAPMSNSEINDDMRCLEMQLRMDISNRKLQVLQKQQSQLLSIQEAAKTQLDKLRRHKQMEQMQLINQLQQEKVNQSQQYSNQTNKVFSVQSLQQLDNSNQGGRNSTTQMHNQTDFSFQPINPMTFSIPNNENILNQNHNENHLYNRENTNYNCYSDNRPNNQNENKPKQNGHTSIISDEGPGDNNHQDSAENPGDFSRVDEGLMNISKRLMAIDAMMETRSEVEALTNSTFTSSQCDYEEKLRELQNKKQQMDSLVADLQQLNKQAARDAELRGLLITENESRNSETEAGASGSQEEPLPGLRSNTAEGSTSSVGNEVAQINAMKVQLARLKDMMDTMKYIEARTGGSDVDESLHSNSPQSSLCEHQSASTIETTNYADSWASSTMKPNNVDHMSRIPYKALISDNENLNSVSNWLESDGGERNTKYSGSSLANNPSIGGLSLETVQSLSQELREQANVLSAERERLVQAQNQILSRPGRSTSMSSNNSYSNRPEKCINQQTSHKHLQKSQSSSGNEPGPKERQQQMLKAELEAKKRELEELMKKDRNLSSQINQSGSNSSIGAKEEIPPDANPIIWSNEQSNSRFQSKTSTRKSSGQSASLSDVDSKKATQRSREGSESTVVTSLPDIDIGSCNADYNQQSHNMPLRNASRHSNNTTPPVPPPMPDMNFRKDSQDSSSYTSPSSQNNNSNQQGQFNWQPRLAQHLQAQFDMYFNHCQNLAMAAAAANNQNVSNQTSLPNINPPMLPNYLHQTIPSYSHPLISHGSELGLFYQLLNPSLLGPTPPGLGTTFNPYCPCNNALWQIVWLQQREIANFGRALCSLQEHVLQVTSKTSGQNTMQSASNNSIGQHPQTASAIPVLNTMGNLSSQLLPNQQSQVKITQTNNNMTNMTNAVLPSNSTQQLSQDAGVLNASSSEPNANSSMGINFISPNFENLQYVHNNTTGHDLSSHNLNLLNHGQIFHNGEFANMGGSTNNHITLNNQVPPGNRANNYWDNFRSYSRQNLLSGNSKTSKESTSTSTCQAGPSPLVTRSHNALRTAPSTSQASLLSLPKQNTQSSSEFQINNINQDQANASDVNLQRQPGVRNQILETQPDVLNVNQNVLPIPFAAFSSNTLQPEVAGGNNFANNNSVLGSAHIGSSVNYPEIIQTHSSYSDIAQQNLKANLPVKSTGPNKKKSKISAAHGVNESDNHQQQNTSETKPDPNLLTNENLVAQPKSTVKPVDQLKEAVYGEVTALIAQNESRPQYLLQLFQNLRQVGCDPLRQQALNEIQNLVSAGSSTMPTVNTTSSTSAHAAGQSANTSNITKSPSKSAIKSTGAIKKGNVAVRKDGHEPTTSQSHTGQVMSSTDISDQRCSSTSDEQYDDQINLENDQGASFNNGSFEEIETNCMDVSCSEQACSPYVSKPERNSETSRTLNRFSESLVSSLNNIHLSEENSIEINNLLLSVMQPNNTNNTTQNAAQSTSNEAQNLYRTNNTMDNAMPCNEDLAEADQIRTSNTHIDTISMQATTDDAPRNNRNVLEADERSGDGLILTAMNPVTRQEDEIDLIFPLPDLARIGPGGDHDIMEANRLVLNPGFDHGLDRVPTRLSNGPWSPESSANESNNDTSIHSNAED